MKHIFFIFLILQTSFLLSQERHTHSGNLKAGMPINGTIKGTVTDINTKKPVIFANAVLYSKKDSSLVSGVISNEKSFFELTNVKYGRYFLEVDFIGYYKKTIDNIIINPKSRNINVGEVFLKQSLENIEGVEVTAEQDFIEYKIDRKVINISKSINSTGGTLVDVLENTPSVQVDIDGNVTMRGSSNFMVLIDGKPSVLDANDILQQIPASSVENIEIITNPSVKFDPDGTTGIINVIMKKGKKTGLTGIVNVSIGTGNKYSTDFLLNYRTKKFNYFIGANYGDRTYTFSGKSLRKTVLNDTINFLNSESIRSHQRKYYSIKGGMDFYINKKNTVSLSAKYGFFGFGMGTDFNINEYSNPYTSNLYFHNTGRYDVDGGFYSVSFDYTHKFNKKGHEIFTSAQYSDRNGGIINNIKENNTTENYIDILSSIQSRTFQNRAKKIIRLKLDYTFPITNKIKFEAGLQSRMRNTPGDYKYENYIAENWIIDETYSNNFTLIRNIHSIYSTLSGDIIGLQFMLGLRGEYTDRLIEKVITKEYYPLQRFDIFPSIHLTKKLSGTQQIQTSYSKRVNRPRHWYLNPFPGYSDSYSVRIGNPSLIPEYVDSYELSYNKQIKKSSLNITAYFRQTNNSINRIQKLTDDGRILKTFDNLDKKYAFGSEISGNIEVLKWWLIYANSNIYRFNLEGETAGVTTSSKSTNYDFRLKSTFIFSKNNRFQVDGVYNAPTVTAQGNREGFFYFGAAYKHSFFKRKLSVTFKVRDIFKTGNYNYTVIGEGFSSSENMYREAPVFTLSLSYKINNYKQKRREREGMDEGNEGGI